MKLINLPDAAADKFADWLENQAKANRQPKQLDALRQKVLYEDVDVEQAILEWSLQDGADPEKLDVHNVCSPGMMTYYKRPDLWSVAVNYQAALRDVSSLNLDNPEQGMVSHVEKHVVFKPPFTGSRSMHVVLTGAQKKAKWKPLEGPDFKFIDDSYKFTVTVNDPYERLVLAYLSMAGGSTRYISSEQRRQWIGRHTRFDRTPAENFTAVMRANIEEDNEEFWRIPSLIQQYRYVARWEEQARKIKFTDRGGQEIFRRSVMPTMDDVYPHVGGVERQRPIEEYFTDLELLHDINAFYEKDFLMTGSNIRTQFTPGTTYINPYGD